MTLLEVQLWAWYILGAALRRQGVRHNPQDDLSTVPWNCRRDSASGSRSRFIVSRRPMVCLGLRGAEALAPCAHGAPSEAGIPGTAGFLPTTASHHFTLSTGVFSTSAGLPEMAAPERARRVIPPHHPPLEPHAYETDPQQQRVGAPIDRDGRGRRRHVAHRPARCHINVAIWLLFLFIWYFAPYFLPDLSHSSPRSLRWSSSAM
mmetsp:Transcript_7797/g.11784  ORF Transcript_7797/g.11784 Transcript_7797/m.11784 type:complete len:205 (+) Transcript_7797:57-671(+)